MRRHDEVSYAIDGVLLAIIVIMLSIALLHQWGARQDCEANGRVFVVDGRGYRCAP